MPPTTKDISSRVSFASLTPNNVGTVKKLNSVLFPVKYSDKFYAEILQPDVEDFCRLVYYNDIPVGIICCRIELKGKASDLYLLTMGVLAPYRHLGVGSYMLQQISDSASSHTKSPVQRIYLHVQISNDGAKSFYEKHGFVEVGVDDSYYKKIKPSAAWILEKAISRTKEV
ncbi:N-acetyltransferase NAT13 [Vararia minispora EC-137]|uniref:N-acetyltransferase NAT13 n=1 Tax=Vararia minispora EC-137 TaxID=1314806 RepID=A0ACB8QLL4_9AGAM|nr:N-acetyltransferase NAT13 [Vararia minispora EC-137]